MPAFIATIWKKRDEQAAPASGPRGLAPVDGRAVACGAAVAAPARGARQGGLDAAQRAAGNARIGTPRRSADLGAWRQRGRKPVGTAVDRKIAGERDI